MKLFNPLVPWIGSSLSLVFSTLAQVPDNLVLDGVPSPPAELRAEVAQYLEFRAATFQSWHPSRHEMLITTRFADTVQLHQVKMAGGARRQLTFSSEPVAGGAYQTKGGEYIVYSRDMGGGEFYQLYRYDLSSGKTTLLTDGRSRNTGMRWSRSGRWLAYTSTRRNGTDNDIYVMDPSDVGSDRLLVQVNGGGWNIEDWTEDESKLLLIEFISINESKIHLADTKTGALEQLTSDGEEKVSYGQARFAPDGRMIYVTTDKDGEFLRLGRLELESKQFFPLTSVIPWDVTEFDLSPNGQLIAFVTNEDGISRLHLLETKSDKLLPPLILPLGVISGLKWHEDGSILAFSLTSSKSPSDVYTLYPSQDGGRVERWTDSEMGGLNPQNFVDPELVKMKSFDEQPISAFVYRPDPEKFPGKRPALINIHGGPEAQARPVFQARINYLLNEMGVAVIYPNVRGSSGYGKTYLTLDNGLKREDAVRDIGRIIAWAQADERLDGERLAVTGGSYGGYMVLASMVHFNDQLRCGIDIVGISNFLSFLKNTQDYRRDLRRAEYGDERDETIRAFLEKISPINYVSRISKPIFIVQGKNDPRVPWSESEQMVKALRSQGGAVWYLLAKDEGHGFAKKRNADAQFVAIVQFLQARLLN